MDEPFDNVMIDLETLGTRPGSVIVAIGAVPFNRTSVDTASTFYRVVSTRSCLAAGLSIDPDTEKWWAKQDESVRAVLEEAKDASSTGYDSIGVALVDLATGIRGRFVWSNGADFDLPILAEAYLRCGLGNPPWGYQATRCYRTIRALRPDVAFVKSGVAHTALDDAISQAHHAVRLLASLQRPPPVA
jgi:3'-5' exoribonuclease-like protein